MLSNGLQKLTPRLLKVAELAAQGFTNGEIAEQLSSTENVIKNVMREIFDRLGLWNRMELTLYMDQHHSPSQLDQHSPSQSV
jgi:two-component system, NarL family, nitrate/nitrite response regulator NarL